MRDSTNVPSRWPQVDLWLFLLVLIGAALLGMLTFEMWISHPLSH